MTTCSPFSTFYEVFSKRLYIYPFSFCLDFRVFYYRYLFVLFYRILASDFIMVLEENINVSARVRPFSNWIGDKHQSCLRANSRDGTISVTSTAPEKIFNFNYVFDEDSKQVNFFVLVLY